MWKISLAVDGSDSSTHAVEYLERRLGAASDVHVLVLHVQAATPSAGEVSPLARAIPVEALTRQRSDSVMSVALGALARARIEHNPYIEAGDAAEAIVRFAREQGCDEIVMGRRGMGAIGSVFLGSVSRKVLDLTDVPVTLVK